MTFTPVVDNSPEATRAFRETLGLSPRMAGPPREVQTLRLIAQRAQVAGPEDAEEALTWIYRMATQTADAVSKPAPTQGETLPSDAMLEAGREAVYAYTGCDKGEPSICCALALASDVWNAMEKARWVRG